MKRFALLGKDIQYSQAKRVHAELGDYEYILIEIDNNSRLVKKPKLEINKDREESGSYQREKTVQAKRNQSL